MFSTYSLRHNGIKSVSLDFSLGPFISYISDLRILVSMEIACCVYNSVYHSADIGHRQSGQLVSSSSSTARKRR